MIDINVKIHDKYSVEFKIGLKVKYPNLEKFAVNTWIFVPNSLDIDSQTYTKQQFYTDVKTNIRLITPRYLLASIAEQGALPYENLKKTIEEYNADQAESCRTTFTVIGLSVGLLYILILFSIFPYKHKRYKH